LEITGETDPVEPLTPPVVTGGVGGIITAEVVAVAGSDSAETLFEASIAVTV
jgi:hypothetical protein